MTKLQEILALQKQLPCLDEEIKNIQEAVIDDEYDAHHAVDVWASCTIGDYQVLRRYDIEIDVNMNWEYDLIETLPEDQRNAVVDENDELRDNFYELYPPEDYMYQFEVGEYFQVWYNVKDHSIYKLGRIYSNPEYCDLYGRWTDLTNRLNKRKQTFLKRFDGTSPYLGFYRDFSVHPDLIAAGYEGINAFNWYYGCGEDENYSPEANFVKNKHMDVLFTDFLENRTDEVKLIRRYGWDNYLDVMNETEEGFQKELIAVLRIVQRHHYTISDRGLWKDMVKTLYKLKKDLHNPFYVCPANLQEAHDKIAAEYQRQQKRIYEQQRRERLKEQAKQAVKEIDTFIQHMEAFFKLCFQDENIVIRPLRSPMEYVEEGEFMHHCVASYKDRYNSLILSIRDHEENRIATAEVSLRDYSIVQIRGKCNKPTEYDQEIAVLITQNMPKIRRAHRKQQKLTAALAA